MGIGPNPKYPLSSSILKNNFYNLNFYILEILYSNMGYIGIYNTTIEDFIIGKVRIGGLDIDKRKLSELYYPHFEKCINNTEYLNEIVPAKGFFVIGYGYNFKNEAKRILVELLTQEKTKRFNCDLFFSEETETYHENYKITKRFAGMGDCSIIPDKHLSHLCDMLVIMSDQTFTKKKQEQEWSKKAERFSYSYSNCNIL